MSAPSAFRSALTGTSGQFAEASVVPAVYAEPWNHTGRSTPSTRSSKCRWAPVAFPVSPTWPTMPPWSICWPCTTQTAFRWAYTVLLPSPWSMIT